MKYDAYGRGSGDWGAVEHEAYCMPSEEKRNVDSMSEKMGYHDMGNLANTKPWPAPMGREHRNLQLGPEDAPDKY